jgi:hypothetical protein
MVGFELLCLLHLSSRHNLRTRLLGHIKVHGRLQDERDCLRSQHKNSRGFTGEASPPSQTRDDAPASTGGFVKVTQSPARNGGKSRSIVRSYATPAMKSARLRRK